MLEMAASRAQRRMVARMVAEFQAMGGVWKIGAPGCVELVIARFFSLGVYVIVCHGRHSFNQCLVRSNAAPAGGAPFRRLMAGQNGAMERRIIATSGHIRSLRSTGADSSIADFYAEIVEGNLFAGRSWLSGLRQAADPGAKASNNHKWLSGTVGS